MIVYVAMSGGVDSSVAAALLKERGFTVRGVFMRYWGDVDDIIPSGEDFTNCCNIEAMNDAQRVCDHLGIPLRVMDLRGKFRTDVVKSFILGYEQGITPNPCVECNRSIKFELIETILSEAAESERDNIFFATGHYIRTSNRYPELVSGSPSVIPDHRSVRDPAPAVAGQARNDDDLIRLFIAADTRKDQSYFLYTLTQEKLQHLLFPIGEYTKPQIRELALKMNLPVALKKESQEVCFVKNNVREFLASRIKNAAPGVVVTTTGEVVGHHGGLPFYTLGQREGLHLGGGGPYYVAQKQFETNTLVVARGTDDPKLLQQSVMLKNVNWISGQPPSAPIRVIAKPRYRHPGAPATITIETTHYSLPTTHCVFDAPERSLTPGQSVVFYQQSPEGLEVLGGGIIDQFQNEH